LKIFATIFLTFSIFVQTFSTLFIKADFYLNRAYIAKNFCVNKDKPMMHCDGKCYLSKKITAQEKQDQQSPVSKNERFDMAPFFVPKPFAIKNTLTISKSRYFIRNENSTLSFHSSIFHPPSV
jgi:hypothetical protein